MIFALSSHSLLVLLLALVLFSCGSSRVVRGQDSYSRQAEFLSDVQRQTVETEIGKFAYDKCTNSSNCAGERVCLDKDTGVECDAGNSCICEHPIGSDDGLCMTSKDCVPEEGCIRPPTGQDLLCMSRAAAETLGYPVIEDESQPTPTPDPSIPSNCTDGHLLDSCKEDDDCRQSPVSAKCWDTTRGVRISGIPCIGGDNCTCLHSFLRICTETAACECGEACIVGIDGVMFCGSRQVAIQRRLPIMDETAPCISINSLQNVARKDLVFKNNGLANVICDSSQSCATAGHMVTFKGRTMMMVSYCKIVGCEKRVMHVNSPKWRRKLKIGSKSEDLVFLAFAARYGTKAEETILSSLVRTGF